MQVFFLKVCYSCLLGSEVSQSLNIWCPNLSNIADNIQRGHSLIGDTGKYSLESQKSFHFSNINITGSLLINTQSTEVFVLSPVFHKLALIYLYNSLSLSTCLHLLRSSTELNCSHNFFTIISHILSTLYLQYYVGIYFYIIIVVLNLLKLEQNNLGRNLWSMYL